MARRQYFIIFIVFIILAVGLGCAALPKIWAKAVPDYLISHMGAGLTVEQANFLYAPPRLVLSNIHLKNPPAFGPGDALVIGSVEVLFADYSYNPMIMQSITASNVKGRLVTRGMDDNFSVLFKTLMAKKQEVPRGEMAHPAHLDKVLTRQVTIQNEEGSIILPMEDSVFQPIGNLSQIAPVQNIVADVLGAILGQQAQAGPALLVKSATDKAVDAIKSIGKAVQDFITAP